LTDGLLDGFLFARRILWPITIDEFNLAIQTIRYPDDESIADNFIEFIEKKKRALEKVKRVHYQNYFAYAYDKKQLTRLEKKRSTKHRSLKIYK
jgi:hypothetical protein